MKIKVLQRSDVDHLTPFGCRTRISQNADPTLHPLERAREYQRAFTAVKMEKIFAKPFVTALDGHTDSVKCMSMPQIPAAPLISGGCDGYIRLWDLRHFTSCSVVQAHTGFVRDLVIPQNGQAVYSCGDDKTVKRWNLNLEDRLLGTEASMIYHTATIPNSIDHHWTKPLFVTAGDTVDVWDHGRSMPVNSFEWGCDRVITTRFNPAEPALIASTAADNSIGLYDLRGSSAIRKVILRMRSNGLCWNPMQPIYFTVANEDCNLYTFDMRKLDTTLRVRKDHVMAALDVAYNPTGQELVAGSYDGTIRIWTHESERSREVYHTKRMQRVLCCCFTPCGRFVLSGSEDTNIRVWKTTSHQKLGVLSTQERQAAAYREALKERFERFPEIRRIKIAKHVPKMIKNLTNKRRIIREAKERRVENRQKYAKKWKPPVVKKWKQAIRKELE